MTASRKTQGMPDGSWTPAHRAALDEWSRLRATGALPDPADEQVVRVGPTVLLHQFGATIEGPTIRCSRDRGLRRIGRPLLWLLGRVVRLLAAVLVTLLLLVLGLGLWVGRWLRARPRPALVALGLAATALIAAWVGR